MLKNAEMLLLGLLSPYQSLFNTHNVLKVLVISAGTFPSCEIFLKVISDLYSQIQQVSFSLVDPAKNKTDLLMNRIKLNNIFPLEITIYNETINHFLEKNNHLLFDVIYFEHSDLRIFPIVLNKMLGIFKNTTILRKSIPYLPSIFDQDTLIIASCLSKQEVNQLRSLLKFSFGGEAKLIGLNNKYLYAGYFSFGLSMQINNVVSSRKLLEIKSEKINSYDNHLLLSLIFGFLILYDCLSNSFCNFFVFFMLVFSFLQLLFYRPGAYNIILNILLCATYSFCLMH